MRPCWTVSMVRVACVNGLTWVRVKVGGDESEPRCLVIAEMIFTMHASRYKIHAYPKTCVRARQNPRSYLLVKHITFVQATLPFKDMEFS
jgi:hypothetical protein